MYCIWNIKLNIELIYLIINIYVYKYLYMFFKLLIVYSLCKCFSVIYLNFWDNWCLIFTGLPSSQVASSVFTLGTAGVLPFYTVMIAAPKAELVSNLSSVKQHYFFYFLESMPYGYIINLGSSCLFLFLEDIKKSYTCQVLSPYVIHKSRSHGA